MKKSLVVFVVLLSLSLAPSAAANEDYLYVVGAVEGSNLYMTFVALGVLGDAFENGVYETATAKDIALEIGGITKNIKESLDKLIVKDLAVGDDRQTILDMIAAEEFLEKQAAELIKYIEDPKVPNDFQYYRGQAWEKISKILGIPAQ